jgi:glycine/D-amino acid oxidase-like deaminating enzyme
MPQAYDAIIVGARCAGSPLAALLARRGYRVLVRGDDHRACPGRRRRGRPVLARGRGRPARTVQREAAAARPLLHLLERSPDGWSV